MSSTINHHEARLISLSDLIPHQRAVAFEITARDLERDGTTMDAVLDELCERGLLHVVAYECGCGRPHTTEAPTPAGERALAEYTHIQYAKMGVLLSEIPITES